MSAKLNRAEAARLTNMALAEAGQPEAVKTTCRWTPGTVDERLAYRASMLAGLHLGGPDYPCYCIKHTAVRLHALCTRITVAEALLGVTCHRGVS